MESSGQHVEGRRVPGLSERLSWCMANRLDPDGDKWTDASLAVALTKRGVKTSVTFINTLRRGVKENASFPVLEGFSRIFSVPLEFWSDERVAKVVMRPRDLPEALAEELAELSRRDPEELAAVLDLASRLLQQPEA
ncbi:hypothetical protein ACX31A_15100 [Dermacoccus nishinomiyaensis]